MAKVKVKVNFFGIKSKILKETKKVLRNQMVRNKIGSIYVDAVQETEKTVTSAKTKAMRAFYEKFNKTDPKYSSDIINMTFTGALMRDLKGNVLSKQNKFGASYIIKQSDKKHPGYKYRSFKKSKKGAAKKTKSISYATISGYLEEKGYNYLDTAYLKDYAKTEREMANFITLEVTKRLKKVL